MAIRMMAIWRNLLWCSIASMAVLAVLYVLQPTKPNLKFKGFKRIFPQERQLLVESARIPLVGKGHYFAGTAGGAVYVARNRMPMRLWRFQEPLADSVPIPLGGATLNYAFMRYHVQGSDLLVMDSDKPFIFRGNTTDWRVNLANTGLYFITGVPLCADQVALLVRLRGKAVLGSLASDSTNGVWHTGLIQHQTDGFFCSFGQLHGQPANNRMVYVYANRNDFFVTDSLLRLQYRARTIDTISRVKIKVGKTDKHTTALASPPMPVNLRSFVDGRWLYVQSNIMAENERPRDFENNAVIDVYDLDNQGQYRHSCYVPLLDGKRPTDFCVMADQVYVLYGNMLVGFRLL